MKYSKLKNEELLTLYKKLDQKAFDEFFKRNSPIIFGFIASRLKNNSEAEEVLQDTFFRIHKYVLRYDANQNAMSWAFAIARNCMIDQIGKRKKHSELKQDMQDFHELQAAEARFQAEAKEELERLLSTLPQEERKLIEDRYLKDDNFDELAKVRGVSQAGVRQRISRIIRKLRDSL